VAAKCPLLSIVHLDNEEVRTVQHRQRLRKLGFIGLCPLLASACLAVLMPAAAQAYEVNWSYCDENFTPDETCPPHGDSIYIHIEWNLGYAHGEEHETCIDNYYTELEKFSEAVCATKKGQLAEQPGDGLYGYPRAWNGGSVTHIVEGEEKGYKTS
jgi:hypothetical protein